MEKRIRALKAIILVIIMVMELFGADALRAVAEDIQVTTDQTIDGDSSENYCIISGRTLTIGSSVTVTGNIFGSGGIVKNYGTVEMIDGLNGGTINNRDGATIKTIQNSSTATVNNNGTITTYVVDSYDTITNTGTIGTLTLKSDALLNLNGGTITTLTSEAATPPSIVLGGNVNVTSITGAYDIRGTGAMTVEGNLNLTGDYSVSDSIVVTDRTKITVPLSSKVKVKYGDKTYLLEEGNDQTLAELAGHTITITMQDDASQTIEEDTPLPSGEKYLSGKTATATYQAKKGYYFPENYSVIVSDPTAATAVVERSEDAATITVKVTIVSDGQDIAVTLPAATAKTTPAAPTELSGGVGTISGVTNKMEYSKDQNAEEWNAIGGISDSGTGEINDLEAGDWYVRYKETATTNPSAAQTVKVKGIGKATVTVENVSYGKEPVPNAVSETNTGKEAKIEYKKASEEDTAYSETVPTAVGDYTVRATFAETDDYGAAVATKDFSIKYLETPNPPYTLVGTKGENAYYTSEVTVTPADGYQISKTLDGTYQDTLVIKETMEASDIYLVKKSTGEKTDAVVLQAINIDTADPILNVTDGETYKVKSKELEVTDANLSSVTINGAAQSVSGQSFKMNLKESVNPYVIVAEDAAGRSVKATIYVKPEEKTIEKEIPAPSPAYTLSGTKGENGYYTSNVVVKPAKGYMISTELNGTYVESLTIQNSQSGTVFYLRNASGERTGALRLETIKIKKQTPKLSLENGKTYYGDSVDLVIKDACLEQVYLNGVLQNLDGTEIVLQLGSNNGKKKYEITAVDAAGNKKTILVNIAAAWMKTGIIPEGVLVNLETGNGYKLGTGNWKVAGDSTSYSGGTEFYVKKDGSYTFGKK